MKTPKEIIEGAWYECCGCHAHLVDHEKPAMLKAGRWEAKRERAPEYDWTPPPPGLVWHSGSGTD
jgi:hypothetical protein